LNLKPWQKVGWWLFLVCVLSFYLFQRLEALKSGQSVPIDVFVFLVWAALLLAPLFKEMNFFGLQLKQELEETRKQISGQLSAMEYRIQSSVSVNPQFNFGVPTPPPDSQLPVLQQKLDQILGEVTKKPSAPSASDWQPPATSDRVEYLFRARLQIERELRRLYKEVTGTDAPRSGALRLLPNLISGGVIADSMAIVIREVYSVCSPAIHGEEVSDAQVEFVRNVAPHLIAQLKTTRAAP
jgi:hypothetical protein